MLRFGLLLVALQLVAASNRGCTNKGGQCLDYRYYICTAGYESGLCDGDSNVKCCMDCDDTCISNEQYYDQNLDGKCDKVDGNCLDNSNYCSGSYQSGKCGGPSSRQCCVPSSGSSGGSSGGGGSSSGPSGDGCYGDIMDVDTTGASAATASQDNLPGGVSSSYAMAANDAQNMLQWKSMIEQVASELCADAAYIAGIISRETRAGAAIGPSGYGGDGHGYGLMQVDDRYHTIEGGPYSIDNIRQGTQILIDMINCVKSNHRTWTQDQDLKGGLSAYNAGCGNVQSYEGMDVGTTGNDYGNDVTARSQWYKQNGY